MQFRKDQKGSERGGEMEFQEFLHSEGSSFLNIRRLSNGNVFN